MPVYVDNAQIPWRGMAMSHLMADTLLELHAFAAALGMKPEWFQDKSIPHYDVSEGKRQQALRMGAISENCWDPSENMKAVKRAWRIKAHREGRRYMTARQHYLEKRKSR